MSEQDSEGPKEQDRNFRISPRLRRGLMLTGIPLALGAGFVAYKGVRQELAYRAYWDGVEKAGKTVGKRAARLSRAVDNFQSDAEQARANSFTQSRLAMEPPEGEKYLYYDDNNKERGVVVDYALSIPEGTSAELRKKIAEVSVPFSEKDLMEWEKLYKSNGEAFNREEFTRNYAKVDANTEKGDVPVIKLGTEQWERYRRLHSLIDEAEREVMPLRERNLRSMARAVDKAVATYYRKGGSYQFPDYTAGVDQGIKEEQKKGY